MGETNSWVELKDVRGWSYQKKNKMTPEQASEWKQQQDTDTEKKKKVKHYQLPSRYNFKICADPRLTDAINSTRITMIRTYRSYLRQSHKLVMAETAHRCMSTCDWWIMGNARVCRTTGNTHQCTLYECDRMVTQVDARVCELSGAVYPVELQPYEHEAKVVEVSGTLEADVVALGLTIGGGGGGGGGGDKAEEEGETGEQQQQQEEEEQKEQHEQSLIVDRDPWAEEAIPATRKRGRPPPVDIVTDAPEDEVKVAAEQQPVTTTTTTEEGTARPTPIRVRRRRGKRPYQPSEQLIKQAEELAAVWWYTSASTPTREVIKLAGTACYRVWSLLQHTKHFLTGGQRINQYTFTVHCRCMLMLVSKGSLQCRGEVIVPHIPQIKMPKDEIVQQRTRTLTESIRLLHESLEYITDLSLLTKKLDS